MHIRKYDFNYGRRQLLHKTAKGVGAAGVLTPLWPMVAKADTPDTSKAYPDELLSVEAQTKGKIKPGDILDANNVEHAKHLLDEIAYKQIKTMGRKVKIKAPVTNLDKLFENGYLEATLKNRGKAVLDDDGNIWYEKAGTPWKGGNPFPDPENGLQAQSNLCLSWGRHDYSQYAIRDWDIGPDGKTGYQYDFVWVEMNVTARLDGKIWKDQADKLRYQSVFFTAPNEQAGTSFLNGWSYDQSKFPDLIGYLPAFKRVREYPASQRFEPLVPGFTGYLSDAWAAGDPILTWGDYKIVERKPMLAMVNGNWHGGRHENWEVPVHGGPEGQTFYDSSMEMVPEVIFFETSPVKYPRSPVGKKLVGVDARNGMYTHYLTFDRKGAVWKSFETAFGQYSDGDTVLKQDNGDPIWSWQWVMSFDSQTGRMSRFNQAREVTGGYQSRHNTGGEDVYNKYLTAQAMRRLGA